MASVDLMAMGIEFFVVGSLLILDDLERIGGKQNRG
jgi:hypothetical protein